MLAVWLHSTTIPFYFIYLYVFIFYIFLYHKPLALVVFFFYVGTDGLDSCLLFGMGLKKKIIVTPQMFYVLS